MTEAFEVAELAEEFDEQTQTEPKEPYMKYRLLEDGVTVLTSTDSITCLAAHEKFIAIGTELGRVHIMDHHGFPTENGVYSMHTSSVNHISIASGGDFMTSCGDDGKVIVYNLSDTNENQIFRLDYEIKSVAISPDYAQVQAFVFGHSKLNLISRGTFKRSKTGELATAEGLVRTIKWRGDFIVWADDMRVCVYDVRDHQHIAYIQFGDQAVALYNRMIPCHLTWCTDTCFLIGRGHCLRICQIFERYQTPERRQSSKQSIGRTSSVHIPTGPDSPTGLASRYVELSYQVDLADCLVCGVSRHQTNLLALTVPRFSTTVQSSEIPVELQVIEVDDIDMNQFGPHTYRINREQQTWMVQRRLHGFSSIFLETVPGENTHYIVTPKEIICGEELTTDDKIDWLLSRGHFPRALELARTHPRQLAKHTMQSVGLLYVNYLIETEQFDLAAAICAQILSDRSSWEEQTYVFMRLGHLASLVPFLPTGEDTEFGQIKLSSGLYETVLTEFMDRDPAHFLSLLCRWKDLDLLDSFDGLLRTLVDRIERRISLSDHRITAEPESISESTVLEPSLKNLWQALAVLYDKVGLSEKAIDILVQLHDPRVFEMFEGKPSGSLDRRLVEVLKERTECFMELDTTRALAILLDNIAAVPVDHVVNQLEGKPELLYHYLDCVYNRYPKHANPHIISLIQLYTMFNRDKLLPLLRSTDSYPLSEALVICEKAKLVQETVYLLTRVGRRHDALRLIMTQGGDLAPTGEDGTPPTFEERQSAAAAAAIAYCCEEDHVRSDYRYEHEMGIQQSDLVYGVRLDDDPNETEQEDRDESSGELWQQVVLFAVDKPVFICALLQHASADGLDPRLLLRKISPDMSIPGLRNSLIKLMRNYRLQLELQRSCQRILRTDSHKLFQRLLQSHAKGIRVESNGLSSFPCAVCAQPLIKLRSGGALQVIPTCLGDLSDSNSSDQPYIVFRCSHVCHSSCLRSGETRVCPMCATS
ncbi:Vacuolar protein sorting-associated protein 41 [Clonorchis sinensis]|uniref:Vacuolar protein sorting-associated protein 41 n=1 Tax=Clonorchis sinensis TaxID=79923 RepID=A0A8T1MD84_CLOSI|nr:Vacuolar protein sorting-associated protein 41 [Clonorchis sinensis]